MLAGQAMHYFYWMDICLSTAVDSGQFINEITPIGTQRLNKVPIMHIRRRLIHSG